MRIKLAARQIRQYMSRYDDLRRQQFDVATVALADQPKVATAMLVDDSLYFYSCSLNFLNKMPTCSESKASANERDEYLRWFQGQQQNIVNTGPSVPSYQANVHNSMNSNDTMRGPQGTAGAEVYYYDRSQRAATSGDTPRQLPKQPCLLKTAGPVRQWM